MSTCTPLNSLPHGCAGDPCQVCHLDRITASSGITSRDVGNALRDHNRRRVADWWAAIDNPTDQED